MQQNSFTDNRSYRLIPKSDSDLLLNDKGYDLMEEYFQLISSAHYRYKSFILDAATGTGRAASVLSRLGHKIISVDYNPNLKMESHTRITDEYSGSVEYIRLNLENIPLPDNSIDNIVCIDTLHELEKPVCLFAGNYPDSFRKR